MIDVPQEQFEAFVADALDRVPDEFASKVENVAFVVEEDAEGGRLLGRYEGIPVPRRWRYGAVPPDKITIFRRAICRMCDTEEEVREAVYQTVVHELGHYFGFDDARLRALGW